MWCWALWKAICGVLYGTNDRLHLPQFNWVTELHTQFTATHLISQRKVVEQPQEPRSWWVLPKSEELRLDIDDSYNKATGLFGIGYVLRDHRGKILVAVSHRVRWPGNVLGSSNSECTSILCGDRFWQGSCVFGFNIDRASSRVTIGVPGSEWPHSYKG